MDVLVEDGQYGRFPVPEMVIELLDTLLGRRMSKVSHGGIPLWLTEFFPWWNDSTRRAHTLGVVHLVEIATRHPSLRPWRDRLIAAATLHDWGSPPFSHTLEGLLEEVSGRDHVGILRQWLRDDPAVSRILSKCGVSLEEVLLLIEGRHPDRGANGVICGNFDADTFDGTLRFRRMLGHVEDKELYSPEKAAGTYRLLDGELVMQGDPVLLAATIFGWEQHREAVYRYIHSPDFSGLAAGVFGAAMLAGLDADRYLLGDRELWEVLRSRPDSSSVVSCLERGELPWSLTEFNFSEVPQGALAGLFADRLADVRLTRWLCQALGLKSGQVVGHVGQSRAVKKGLPLLDPEGQPLFWETSLRSWWFAQAYAMPGLSEEVCYEAARILIGLILTGEAPPGLGNF